MSACNSLSTHPRAPHVTPRNVVEALRREAASARQRALWAVERLQESRSRLEADVKTLDGLIVGFDDEADLHKKLRPGRRSIDSVSMSRLEAVREALQAVAVEAEL